jgi:hypothetical protein
MQRENELLVIVYPKLGKSDFEKIQNQRKLFDKESHAMVLPHFTFVFPVTGMQITEFASEVRKQIAGATAIRFAIRCAAVNRDTVNDCYHTFLIPGKGCSKMVKLHDSLYSDKLSSHRRTDIDFIPHITIGTAPDAISCKKMADDWNQKDGEIRGILKFADIVQHAAGKVITLQRIKLRKK